MKITTIGIDIAKDVFQIHGVNSQGKTLVKKQIRRHEMLNFFVNLQPCLIGMEALTGLEQIEEFAPRMRQAGQFDTRLQ
jgi:transposase